MLQLRTTLAAGAVVFCAASVDAHDYTRGGLFIDHPWSRATPQGFTVGSGYLVIRNRGKTTDRLVSVTTPIAGKVEIHRTAVKDGVVTMRMVEGGLLIASGKSVELAPHGLHLMLLELKHPLKEGDRFPATLMFEKVGAVQVEFQVESIRTTAPSKHNH